jgi:hypothetical protein
MLNDNCRHIQVMQHVHHLKGATGDLFCFPRQQAADGDMPGGQEPTEDRNAVLLGLASFYAGIFSFFVRVLG